MQRLTIKRLQRKTNSKQSDKFFFLQDSSFFQKAGSG
jgi:hypothetical protein